MRTGTCVIGQQSDFHGLLCVHNTYYDYFFFSLSLYFSPQFLTLSLQNTELCRSNAFDHGFRRGRVRPQELTEFTENFVSHALQDNNIDESTPVTYWHVIKIDHIPFIHPVTKPVRRLGRLFYYWCVNERPDHW